MKPFSEIEIADGISPGENVDVINDIYVPVLQNSNLHQRLTYSFSAYGLVELAVGLEKFIKNDGKMQLIIGSTLSEGEEKAIYIAETQLKKNEQYQKLCMKRLDNLFESIINDSSVVDSHVPKSLDLLTNLIASKSLEIKFAYKKNTMKDLSDISIQHSKIAIFHGVNDEKVAWGGSTNLSVNAFVNSIEEISVFKSWDMESGYKRHGKRLIEAFNKVWNDKVDDWHTCAVPSRFYKDWRDFHKKNFRLLRPAPTPAPTPASALASNFRLRGHQEEAIENWVNNSFKGIVEHATGSGKTITGIYAIKHFFNNGGTNAIVIVPSKILQHQWLLEISEHLPDANIHLVGGAVSKNKWLDNVNPFTSRIDRKFQVVIGVRQSVCNKDFYSQIKTGHHLMILADEVHTLGASESRHFLENIDVPYRLGLSATYKRSNDFLGTKRILNYFGNPLEPKYGLAEAIAEERLVKYDYHVETVSLNAEEEENWINQSKKISKEWARYASNKKDKPMPQSLKMLLIERSKIVKKAKNKIPKAMEVIKNNYLEAEDAEDKRPQRWLIYCQDIQQLEELSIEIRKIGISCSIYYADLEDDSKKLTLDLFYKKGGLLLSIKCLDEGVNIPAADHALIMASSANKREYIQRRGRVLRKDPNNKYKRAKIFDLITTSPSFSEESIKNLVKTELIRAYEFSSNARNENISKIKISELFAKYRISLDEISYEDEDEDIEIEEKLN